MNRFSCGDRDTRGHACHRSGRALISVLGLVLALGFVGLGQATTTTLEPDVNPSVYRQAVTFTATVSPIPTGGTVTFRDGGVAISGAIPVSTTTGRAEFSTSALPVGARSITAEYSGTTGFLASTSGPLIQTVNKRPVSVSVVLSQGSAFANETITITVTVSDASGVTPLVVPTGDVTFSASAAGIFSPSTCSLMGGVCFVDFTPTDPCATSYTLTAAYAGSPCHLPGTGTGSLTIRRRQTQTAIAVSGAGPVYTLTATVTDTSDGTKVTPEGTIEWAYQGGLPATGFVSPATSPLVGGQATTTYTVTDLNAFIHAVTATYQPVGCVHAGSANFVTIRRDPPNIGCWDAGSAIMISSNVCNALNLASAGVGAIPDFDFGDPIAFGLAAAATALCLDIDGDGIMATMELIMGLNDLNGDVDGDGLGDGQELDIAGAYSLVYSPNPPACACPHPRDSDSDGDGLSDGDEFNFYHTNLCDPDSDDDERSDGAELDTWGRPDPRDHADPLREDTDGDGLSDFIEFSPGGPFVNDADSDDDGLQDGYEDKNKDGIITNTIGNSSIQGSGETHFGRWDTDGDGLSDGAEEALFGPGVVSAVTPSGSVTIPALDDDSDNDGLSDWEEVNATHTNPLHWDTDGDGISDANELIATGGLWPRRTFDQESDPLDRDTDDDGLPDAIEYPGTGLGITRGLGGTRDTTCPFVNDADSDDDGLQDGWEDKNKDGTITNAIGNSITQGSGETNFCLRDTDGDGLSDGVEEGLFGQVAVTAVTATGPVTTVPALDDDSDNDGLSDWEEVNATHTNPLHWDTDGDGISDANELIATGGLWPRRTFDQESDPLDRDTDDDGLPDAIEYPGTGLGITRGLGGTRDTICPFVNDADSDDDGLQDGYEDKNKDGIWNNYTIGSITTQGSGETNPCNPDSDGDGLSDGEEEGLLGRSATPQGVSSVGPVGPPPYTFHPAPGALLPLTVPALDTDSDNDGLSDYEEVNITGTDPLDADTDNDTLKDADELVAISGTWPKRTFDQVSDPLDINTDDDHLFDPQEFAGSGLRGLAGGLGGTRDLVCPFVNDDDSDDDGVQDGAVIARTINAAGLVYTWTHIEGFADLAAAGVSAPGTVRTVVTTAGGEQNDDTLPNVCDCDSDGDGLHDGHEIAIGTDPGDWDTDDDGRSDGHEVLGLGPIPTDPFDPDTDDDGLLDSAEVFGSNPTNPVNADTDADGLCDGGRRTPYMTSGHPSVVFNPRLFTGIGGHPNPLGIGEDEDGNGARGATETDPNNPDTDGDAVGDGIERLSFSVSRQALIPARDFFGRPITVVYPTANNTRPVCGCMDPLNPDSDGDGLLDGEEDLNHDGHFDFLRSDFDHVHHGPIPGPAIPNPLETNPCDPDTDRDGLTDAQERRGQANPPAFFPFNPTNPLDHDTDNDWILDGPEVRWVCTAITFVNLDNDGDGLIDEDLFDLVDNDADGLMDEDDVDFYVRFVPVLDPTNRDSDSDGFIDGLDSDPCNTQLIPIVRIVVKTPVDTDGDGFANDDEVAAGTHPLDPNSKPHAFTADLDLDQVSDDRLWLTDVNDDGTADTVTVDIDSNVLIDIRVQILARDVQRGDFDGDGQADDIRYVVVYAFANRRVIQPRITLTIFDHNADFVIDRVEVTR